MQINHHGDGHHTDETENGRSNGQVPRPSQPTQVGHRVEHAVLHVGSHATEEPWDRTGTRTRHTHERDHVAHEGIDLKRFHRSRQRLDSDGCGRRHWSELRVGRHAGSVGSDGLGFGGGLVEHCQRHLE